MTGTTATTESPDRGAEQGGAVSGEDLAELDARRQRAIASTGWGSQVRLFQPRNLACWVWALLVAWGVLIWVHRTAEALAYYAPAISLAVVVFALYGAVFWWFTQRIDRYAAQPARLRVAAFLWGAFAATWVMAAPANVALRTLYGKLFGQPFALEWGASFAVPVTEEWSKGFGLLLLIAMAPQVVRTAFDGFVLGAFLGLGFQVLEDIDYVRGAAAAGFGADQIGATMTTFLLRITTGVAGHILFTAIFCTGLVYLIGLPEQPRKAGRGVALMLTAMTIHFVWDSQSALSTAILGDGLAGGLLLAAMMPGVPLVALALGVRVFRVAVQGERGFVRDVLAPEVARGVIGQEELAAAAGSRRDRRRYRKAGGGARGRRRHAQLLDAVFDLADELGTAGGRTTDRVAFARSEVARLRTAGGRSTA